MAKRRIEHICKKCGCNLIKERGKFSHMYEYAGKCSTFFLPTANKECGCKNPVPKRGKHSMGVWSI